MRCKIRVKLGELPSVPSMFYSTENKQIKTCKIIETSQKERFEFVAVCSGMSLQWNVATVNVALLDSLKWKSLRWKSFKWK